MSADPQIESLRHGAFQLELAPEIGGVITRFETTGRARPCHWMRPADPRELPRDGPLASACYPLVPFSNRIAQGRFSYRGREVVLPVERRFAPHAIHGQGWRAAWRVVEREEAALTIGYEHRGKQEGEGWPWPYRAHQRFELDDAGLQVEIGLENLGETIMPAGLGLHPHFPASADVRLRTTVTAAHPTDDTLLPVARERDHPAIAAMAAAAPLPRGLDLGFEGWSGEAEILWPEWSRGLRISAGGVLGHLVVFTPPGSDFFCVEPVSHCTDAVNLAGTGRLDGTGRLGGTGWGETGLAHLEPGQSLSARVRFDPFEAETP